MNGNNTQSSKGFIGALNHPRKVELAEMLLAEEVATAQEFVTAGFNRITVLEMVRDIRNNVEGREEFSFEWPRDEEVVATEEEAAQDAPVADAPVADAPQTGQDAPVDPAAETAGEVVDENAAPTNDVPPAPQG